MPHQSDNLEMPPSNCPNSGLCLVVVPRLELLEDRVDKLELLTSTYVKENEAQNAVIQGIKIIQQERDQVFEFIKKVFIAILVAVVMQVGTTIWWAAKLQAAIDTASKLIDDHEQRLRTNESILYGPGKPSSGR